MTGLSQRKIFSGSLILVIFAIVAVPAVLLPQHRGDDLSFQGMRDLLTMNQGHAHPLVFVAGGNDASILMSNPAALGSLDRIALSITGSNETRKWREAQYYRPNRLFVTLPFYLEGYYVPDPVNNGILDYDLALDDTNYVVSEPLMGLDRFSSEAADWRRDSTDEYFSGTLAIPFQFLKRKWVLSGGYTQAPIVDYDRNITYLDPHPGYTVYNAIVKVDPNKDPIRVHWYDFERNRTGRTSDITGGLSLVVNENLYLGLSYKNISLETDDDQSLRKVGYFDLFKENKFSFSFDTLDVRVHGSSSFTNRQMKLGGYFRKNIVSVGLVVTLPTEIRKDSDYTFSFTAPGTSLVTTVIKKPVSNTLIVPATVAFGLGVSPNDRVEFLFDVNNISLGDYSFKEESGEPDTVFSDPVTGKYGIWSNHKQPSFNNNLTVRGGVKVDMLKFMSLFGVYSYSQVDFSPDGAAFKDHGPPETSLTVGLTLKVGSLGSLDISATDSKLKYYDSYYSNTNYAFEGFENYSVTYRTGF